MKIVLLSGGSGQRLWPLSNDIRSKQFLKLLKNEDDEPESMVQRVYRQVRQVDSSSEIVIATSKTQVNSIKNHLGELVDIVIEPERRDTFPAIALSTAYLHFKKNVGLDETISIMPVDPYTNEHFFEKLSELNLKMNHTEVNLGLLGIKPTYASSKYGYILREADSDQVKGFVEKPTEEKAAELINQGALWNGGVFVFKIKYLLNILKSYINFSSYEDVLNQYSNLPKNSFDYEVSEKEDHITMVEYNGSWKDLGTWNTLTEVMGKQTLGNVIISESSTNTHAINELDIPLTVVGAKDIVVAASPDGILVSDKIESAQLKTYIEDLSKTPMFEETAWGNKKTLERNQNQDGSTSITKSFFLSKDHEINYEQNLKSNHVLTIIDGNGQIVTENETDKVKKGNVLTLKNDSSYILRAETDLRFIEVSIREDD